MTKPPRTPNGHKAASTNAAHIRAMAAEYGFVLVGIRTGETSNLAVLDIDKQHNGLEWYEANKHRLPDTYTYRTRSGGLHLWFKHKPPMRCSTAKIAPGIDVKAEGGYIIHWPSAGLEAVSTPLWLAGLNGSHHHPSPLLRLPGSLYRAAAPQAVTTPQPPYVLPWYVSPAQATAAATPR